MTLRLGAAHPRLEWFALLILLCPLLASRGEAQSSLESYVYAGPAGFRGSVSSGGLSLGGGAEIFPSAGPLSVSAELGYLGRPDALADGLAVFCANGSYHFARSRASQTLSPFVTAGYTRLFRPDVGLNAWNVGAGINYRFSERVAVRVELRDHIRTDNRGTLHYWAVRLGVMSP